MTETIERMLPLYEAKMVGAFNHRAADVVKSATAVKRQNQPAYLNEADLVDRHRLASPGSWVTEQVVPDSSIACRVGFLRISSPTNARTLISAILPKVAIGDSVFLMNVRNESDACILVAQMNSFALDYVVRQKLAGLNLNFFYVQQFPFLRPDVFEAKAPWSSESLGEWVTERVAELTLTCDDMAPLAEVLKTEVSAWESAKRYVLTAELDAAMFHLFGYAREDVDYVMDTFPIVKRKDVTFFGSYRTKDLILELYDAMQVSIDSGRPYKSSFETEQS